MKYIYNIENWSKSELTYLLIATIAKYKVRTDCNDLRNWYLMNVIFKKQKEIIELEREYNVKFKNNKTQHLRLRLSRYRFGENFEVEWGGSHSKSWRITTLELHW